MQQMKGLMEYDLVEEVFIAIESKLAPMSITKATIATQDENDRLADTSASLSSTEEEDEEEDTVEDESIKELKVRVIIVGLVHTPSFSRCVIVQNDQFLIYSP